MFKWVKSLFGRKVNEVVVEEVVYEDINVEVTYMHPKHSLPPVRKAEPVKPKPTPRVTADDIRSWVKSVREYDSIRSLCV